MLNGEKIKRDQEIIEEARKFIYDLCKNEELFKVLLGDKDFSPINKPLTIFMAGSPGAGKTEYSKNFISSLFGEKILRVDADELRRMCPNYRGSNSHLFQLASAIGVDKLYNYSLKIEINVLLDGTLSNYEKARENIKRALDKNRNIQIFYIYQEPIRAWNFTQKREKLEKRRITKEVFARSFVLARDNVNKVKKEFGEKITLTIVKKDYNNKDEKVYFNVDNIDDYVKFDYTEDVIIKLIS